MGTARATDERGHGLVLHVRRLLAARRQRVFRALTEPAELAAWWGPRGFTIPEVELDLRVGGRYRFTMQPPDADAFHLAGEFLEVDPPTQLSYTFRWEEPDPDDRTTVARLSLQDSGDATQLALTQGDFATEARLALHRDGWGDSLDKLRDFLGSRP